MTYLKHCVYCPHFSYLRFQIQDAKPRRLDYLRLFWRLLDVPFCLSINVLINIQRLHAASVFAGRDRTGLTSQKHVLAMKLYIEKLGLVGVYLINFLIFDPKHRLRVLVRTASARWFYVYPQSMF